MAKKDGKTVDKKTLINILFFSNLGYVNKLSEFVADSLRLNWLNFIETTKKERYIDKINKNIEKINKLELKINNKNFYKEIIVDNLININNHIKDCDTRLCKKMMIDIQETTSLSMLLKYYLEKYLEYSEIIIKERHPVNKVAKNVRSTNHRLKLDSKADEEKQLTDIIIDYDNSENCYVHIKFVDNVMTFVRKSFDLEVNGFYNNLEKNLDSPFIIENSLKFSAFEKKRRIYVKSVYDLDKTLCELSNKKIDITFPIDKIFKCANDIIDNIYKELVNFDTDKTILNKLMNLTIENYGSKKQLKLYDKLFNSFIDSLPSLEDFVKQEIINSSRNIIIEKGYKEFSDTNELIPCVEDLYKAANEKIIIYLCKNVSLLIKNPELIDNVTKNMDENYFIKLYNLVKSVMLDNRVNIKNYIDFQKKIYSLLQSRFELSDDYIFNNLLKEEKLF